MQKIEKVITYLDELIPEPKAELNFSNTFELLIAAVLSPQCTDKRVNIVTQELFKVAKTPQDYIKLGQERLEEFIYSTGFYRNKAKNIIALCNKVVSDYSGQVPSSVEALQGLPGVGRKVANVVAGVAFGANTFAVDTHVFRVTNRLGLVHANTPEQVEKQFTERYGSYITPDTHHRFVLFGRYTCTAKKPKCAECDLQTDCDFYRGNLKKLDGSEKC